VNPLFAFNVDQNEIVVPRPEHLQALIVTKGRIDVEAFDAKDLITQWAQHLAFANVKDGALLCGKFLWHGTLRRHGRAWACICLARAPNCELQA
jgi:hypothetical protein